MKEHYEHFLATINTLGLITGPPKQKHQTNGNGVMTNHRLGLDIFGTIQYTSVVLKPISLFLSFPHFPVIKMHNKNSTFQELLC